LVNCTNSPHPKEVGLNISKRENYARIKHWSFGGDSLPERTETKNEVSGLGK
jgi:hypothetical protein